MDTVGEIARGMGGFALAYQFILYPLMLWGRTWFKSLGWIAENIDPPPVFKSGPLFAIVTGMLGIGGMRSYDKLDKTQTDRIK